MLAQCFLPWAFAIGCYQLQDTSVLTMWSFCRVQGGFNIQLCYCDRSWTLPIELWILLDCKFRLHFKFRLQRVIFVVCVTLCLCPQPHVCPPFRHTPFSFIICLQSCLVKSITKEKHFSRLGIYQLSFSRNFYVLEADQKSCIFLYLEPDEMAQLHKPRS